MNITEMMSAKPSAVALPQSGAAIPDLPRPRVAPAAADKRKEPVPEQQTEQVGRQATKEAREELESAVNQLNQTANAFHRSVRFNLSHESGQVQVSVVDTDSDKVIREIPPKEMLNMAKRIHDFIGVILDEKR